jgi:hypothetical protein
MTDTCCHCGKPGIYRDYYCEPCFEEHHMYCSICEEWQHEDAPCEHIFWNSRVAWWDGPGSEAAESGWSKDSFMMMLRKTGLAEPIRSALQSGDIRHEIWGDMLSAPNIWLWLNGEFHPDELTQLSHDDDEECVNGVNWLLSLEPGKTVRAIERTIKWIDEFMGKV